MVFVPTYPDFADFLGGTDFEFENFTYFVRAGGVGGVVSSFEPRHRVGGKALLMWLNTIMMSMMFLSPAEACHNRQ